MFFFGMHPHLLSTGSRTKCSSLVLTFLSVRKCNTAAHYNGIKIHYHKTTIHYHNKTTLHSYISQLFTNCSGNQFTIVSSSWSLLFFFSARSTIQNSRWCIIKDEFWDLYEVTSHLRFNNRQMYKAYYFTIHFQWITLK